MPVPDRRRAKEYAVKGAHLAARMIASAPEQRAARGLRRQSRSAIAAPGGSAPRVVFLSPKDWAAHVHWEAMIGHALRLRGADVRFITCGGGLEICDRANTWEAPPMPCTSCTRYVEDSLDAHGFARVALGDEWKRSDDEKWPELDELSLRDLLSVEDDGLDLGALTRVPLSWFLMRASIDDDPLAPQTERAFLRSARRIARALGKTLDRLQPDVVVLCNGLFLFEAIAFALCRRRGIDVVTYERGFIKDTLVLRRNEAACLTPMDGAWAAFADQPLTHREEAILDEYLEDRRHGRRTIDRYWDDAVFASHERSGGGRLAVMFPNLTWDSAVIGQSVAFGSIQEWIVATVEYFASHPEHELVIRLHPAEVKLPGKQTREPIGAFIAERFPTLPDNVRLIAPDDDQSSYPLMDAADVGLVFTSTTGLELALAGKPVIVAGRTHYRGRGFTMDAETPREYEKMLGEVLLDPDQYAPDATMVRRYAYLFFFRSPVDAPGVVEHVPGLARITVDDLDELRPGRSESLDRICDGILRGGNFLPGLG